MNSLPAGTLPILCLLLTACGSGCTSVLSSASLRDLVQVGDDHASEAAAAASDDDLRDSAPTADEPDERAEIADAGDTAEVDGQRREAAIEEAVSRLARLGRLDAAARATLVATLDRTQQEDWPTVIEAFAESLADSGIPVAAEAPMPTGTADAPPTEHADAHVVAKADLDAAVAASPPSATAARQVAPTAPAPSDEADTGTPDPTPSSPGSAAEAPSPAPAAPRPFVVQNACFASRVQGWGVVDRFAVDRFRPGQEVIVYFELEGLSAGESPAGHTTCIDTTLQLLDADGRPIHAWGFEPIAETCRARRHDYFARYVIRLPEGAAAGSCRIDLEVTDTLGSRSARASLPLEIAAPDVAR